MLVLVPVCVHVLVIMVAAMVEVLKWKYSSASGCRRFYFSRLRRARVLLPILSKSFIFSRACETEVKMIANSLTRLSDVNLT